MTLLCSSSISTPVLHAKKKKEMNLKAHFSAFSVWKNRILGSFPAVLAPGLPTFKCSIKRSEAVLIFTSCIRLQCLF